MALNNCPERQIVCPYESSHIVSEEKLQVHLSKCKHANKKKEYSECPFKSTHLVHSSKIMNHLEECDNRGKFETFMYTTEKTKNLFPIKKLDFPSSENWDNVDCPTYDPDKVCEEKAILRSKAGATPSERRQFRMQERLRIQNMNMLENAQVQRNNSGPTQFGHTEMEAAQSAVNQEGSEEFREINNVQRQENLEQPGNGDGFVIPRYLRRRNRSFL